MNSQKTNPFLSASKAKPKEFLNNLNDLSRKMYDHQDKPVIDTPRFEGDMLLNQGVRKSNLSRDKDRIIRDMTEEIKGLKSQIALVMDKDKEIYRLQCEATILRNENEDYKNTTVTDDSLKRDNEDLRQRVSEMTGTIQEMEEMSVILKRKLIDIYKENQDLREKSRDTVLPEVSDSQLASYIRSRLRN